MKGGKFSLTIIFFLLSLCSVSTASIFLGVNFTNTLISDNFEYSSSYVSNGWDYSDTGSGCSGFSTSPYYDPLGERGFGFIINSSCISQVSISKLSAFYPISSGRVHYKFDIYINSNHTNIAGGTIATVRCGLNSNTFNFNINDSFNTISIDNNRISGEDCTHNLVLSRNIFHTIDLDIDFSTQRYSVYIDNISGNCGLIKLGTDSGTQCIDGFIMYCKPRTNYFHNFFFDNILIESTSLGVNLSQLLEPCTNNSMCANGKCENHQCVPMLENENCDSNSDCISGSCIYGKCSKPSLSELISTSKSEMFGDDSITNNMVSLFLMIGIASAIALGGGGSALSVLLGIAIFISLGFLFAIMGWLSAFILIGIVLSVLIIAVLIFVMLGNQS